MLATGLQIMSLLLLHLYLYYNKSPELILTGITKKTNYKSPTSSPQENQEQYDPSSSPPTSFRTSFLLPLSLPPRVFLPRMAGRLISSHLSLLVTRTN